MVNSDQETSIELGLCRLKKVTTKKKGKGKKYLSTVMSNKMKFFLYSLTGKFTVGGWQRLKALVMYVYQQKWKLSVKKKKHWKPG